jgi:hypothetical protein
VHSPSWHAGFTDLQARTWREERRRFIGEKDCIYIFTALCFEYTFRYFREQLLRRFISHSFLLSLGAEARFRAHLSSQL